MYLLKQRYGRLGLFFVLATLLTLEGCRTKLVHKPTWKLHGVEIGAVNATEATLQINVKITNPNPVTMVVERVTYRLIFNEATLARGEKVGAFEFRPYQEAGISLPVSVDLATLLAQLPFLKGQEKAGYHVEGEVVMTAFGIRKTFPFREPDLSEGTSGAPPASERAPVEKEVEEEGHRTRP